MKLLIVDDESDAMFLFQQKFRKEIKEGKMQMYFALNGSAALELLEAAENCTDYYILTDINMPEMSGLELLEAVKIKYPKLKVIIVTAYGDEQNLNKAKKLGAEAYFTKPIQFNLLKTKLYKLATI